MPKTTIKVLELLTNEVVVYSGSLYWCGMVCHSCQPLHMCLAPHSIFF